MWAKVLLYGPMEVLVILLEAIALPLLLKEQRKGTAVGCSVMANILSWFLGAVLLSLAAGVSGGEALAQKRGRSRGSPPHFFYFWNGRETHPARAFITALATLPALSMPPSPSSTRMAKA